mmetsp:Transcript_110889/g.278794  ORF Transcript_110889/g.278794 Transcript_110889/m.278794 type:complete len:232 (+) Transcript_110889:1333-2028(+)
MKMTTIFAKMQSPMTTSARLDPLRFPPAKWRASALMLRRVTSAETDSLLERPTEDFRSVDDGRISTSLLASDVISMPSLSSTASTELTPISAPSSYIGSSAEFAVTSMQFLEFVPLASWLSMLDDSTIDTPPNPTPSPPSSPVGGCTCCKIAVVTVTVAFGISEPTRRTSGRLDSSVNLHLKSRMVSKSITISFRCWSSSCFINCENTSFPKSGGVGMFLHSALPLHPPRG